MSYDNQENTRVYWQTAISKHELENYAPGILKHLLERLRYDFIKQFCAYPEYLVVSNVVYRILTRLSNATLEDDGVDWVLRKPLKKDGQTPSNLEDRWIIANMKLIVLDDWEVMEEKAHNNELFNRIERLKMEAFLTNEQLRAANRNSG